ncbi:MFS transporter [Streptomyces sp. BE147]|uniref:MFS transporter n=1 Tax=unclassified Streptomyces TaxID=2593676 RepID=UPI002E778758|nr:MFS transporter [Streptomyces sp. BE147]MEE1742632.1 MFS transporter [Streptomyces sp. BE147]
MVRPLLLRDPNLRRFILARSFSRAGDAVFPIGLTAVMVEQDFSTSAVGLVLGASMVPVVALMLVGGVLLDHFQPRTPMVIADLTRFALQAVLALLFLSGRPALWQILVIVLCTGVAQALFQPGAGSLLKQVVRGDTQPANAALRAAESVVSLAAPAGAGFVIMAASASAVIALDALSFAASAVLLWRIRLAAVRRAVGRPDVRRELKTGWHEFAGRPWLWSTVGVFALFGLLVFGPFDVLKAVLLIERFGATTYGLLISTFSLGAMAGGVIAWWAKPARPLKVGVLSLMAFAPLPAGIAFGAPLSLLALCFFMGGTANAFWAVMWTTTVQSHSPPHVLSRIHSYEVLGSMGLVPAGRALAGPVATGIGASAVLLTSTAVLLLGGLALLLVPAVVHLRRLAPAEPVTSGTEPSVDSHRL